MTLLKRGAVIAQKKEVKAILFDMDGVLTDSFDAWCHIINDAMREIGKTPLSKSVLRKHFGAPVERDQKTHFKGYTIEEIRKMYLKHYFTHWKKIRLFPDTLPVLKKVAGNGWKIGLISNSTKDIINPMLKRHGIARYFDAVMSMDDVKNRKPHPEMVIKACRILNVKPSETIVIGDTQNDMLAGKSAGCLTIGIGTKGDYTIRRLSSITRFLK
jgi:HAD superfamily hydrolase (TIGR01509 family)